MRDLDSKVQASGRSAVQQSAVERCLQRSQGREIAEAYHRAYSDSEGLGEEFASWEVQGKWPPN